ncbi:MAG: hypothetical protein IJ574_02005 [Bacilli bacterium]|nr:hypothetical protein [Bacilli bacterium]
MKDILGNFNLNNKIIKVNNRKVNYNNLFVYIKGTIFNVNSNIEEYIRDSYITKGIEFIKELDGNFAIVIYDKDKDELYLIKDKLGTTFLYYYYNDNELIFSTSLRQIINSKNFTKEIDKQVLSNFLGYTYIYEPYTIFKNTFKVKKGSYIKYSNNNLEENIYFDLYKFFKENNKKLNTDDDTLIEEFTNLFTNSLKKIGNKNSNIGVFLSSGTDSSLLTKLSKDLYNNVNTYTANFEDGNKESVYSKRIAKYIGVSNKSYEVKKKDLVGLMNIIREVYDEPFADPSILPSTYLFSHIKDKNDFIITGDSCDAMFANSSMYNIYGINHFKQISKKLVNIRCKKRVYHNYSEYAQVNILARFNFSDKIVGVRGKCKKVKKVDSKVRNIILFDLLNTVTEKFKVKTTSLANYYGIKNYTPYFDIDILKKTFEININKMHRNNKGKYIFNKILYNNIPEKYFSEYKKKGFGIPTNIWCKDVFVSEARKLSTKEFIDKQGLFIYDELISLFNDFEQEPNYNKALVIWNYYVFQNWYKGVFK